MYLVQYKEICEKQGWKFEFCDGDLNVRITLPSLPSKPFFTVSKENFAENITALSDNHLLDEYAKITSTASTTGSRLVFRQFLTRVLRCLQRSMPSLPR